MGRSYRRLFGGHVRLFFLISVVISRRLDKTVTLAPHQTIDRPILFTVKVLPLRTFLVLFTLM